MKLPLPSFRRQPPPEPPVATPEISARALQLATDIAIARYPFLAALRPLVNPLKDELNSPLILLLALAVFVYVYRQERAKLA